VSGTQHKNLIMDFSNVLDVHFQSVIRQLLKHEH